MKMKYHYAYYNAYTSSLLPEFDQMSKTAAPIPPPPATTGTPGTPAAIPGTPGTPAAIPGTPGTPAAIPGTPGTPATSPAAPAFNIEPGQAGLGRGIDGLAQKKRPASQYSPNQVAQSPAKDKPGFGTFITGLAKTVWNGSILGGAVNGVMNAFSGKNVFTGHRDDMDRAKQQMKAGWNGMFGTGSNASVGSAASGKEYTGSESADEYRMRQAESMRKSQIDKLKRTSKSRDGYDLSDEEADEWLSGTGAGGDGKMQSQEYIRLKELSQTGEGHSGGGSTQDQVYGKGADSYKLLNDRASKRIDSLYGPEQKQQGQGNNGQVAGSATRGRKVGNPYLR